MINPNKFIRIKNNTTIYPNKPAVICDILNSDNTIFESTIHKRRS